MIKGTKRKMIVVTPDKGSIFEQAFFLVRPGVFEVDIEENEMVKEADRIISESLIYKKRRADKPSGERRGLYLFLPGLLLGFALCLFCLFVFSKIVM